MADPFIGEVRAFALPYVPQGWAPCDGQLLSIPQYTALYSILGATYGGDGVNTFALPNLKGRVPVHFGQTIAGGQAGGEEEHTLTTDEMPLHNHGVQASSADPTEVSPQNAVPGSRSGVFSANEDKTMSPQAVSTAGRSRPHSNMQPFTVVNFCIAVQGFYPSHK